MKNSILILLASFFWLGSIAQDTSSTSSVEQEVKREVEKGDFLLGLQIGIPSAEMKKAIRNQMGNMGFGITIMYLTNPMSWGKNKRNSPIRIGGELSYTYYGRFITDVQVNGYPGDFKTTYGILNLNAILRIKPPQSNYFTPFFDAIIGGNFYISSTRENLSVIESSLGIEALDMDTYASTSLNKALGLGFSLGGSKSNDAAKFICRVTCNWGDEIKYVVRNSVTYNSSSNKLSYEVGRAPVKYVLVQLGIGI